MFLKLIRIAVVISILFISCKDKNRSAQHLSTAKLKVRQLADTIGFTQYKWQLDSIISRIHPEDKRTTAQVFKTVICPHDDYGYAAGLYNKTLEGIKAKTIVLIGVAHKARNFGLENKLVFGAFNEWKSSDGIIKISSLRDELIKNLNKETYIVHDSMMQLEHSLEAITPFLEKNNNEIEIIPLLVPYITFEKMNLFSSELANTLNEIMKKKNLKYGEDLAIVISNDAIHYGDEGWGGSNLAPFGVDSLGNEKARQKDLKIIKQCLVGELNHGKMKTFNQYTIQTDNFKEYKWTWCGRYSVPFGLLFANELNNLIENRSLTGEMLGYRSSYPNSHIKVNDLGSLARLTYDPEFPDEQNLTLYAFPFNKSWIMGYITSLDMDDVFYNFNYVELDSEPSKHFVKYQGNHGQDPEFSDNFDHGYSYLPIIKIKNNHSIFVFYE